MVFKKAKKEQAKLRMALSGPSGSGKTYTALNLARFIGKKVAVIDTEGNSASKYANLFDFDVLNLTDCHPRNFIQAIDEACREKYDVIIIDSLSHAWNGKNGILELTEREKLRITNKFQAWGKTSPIQTELVNKLLTAQINIIATLRVKTAYDLQEDDNGKKKPVKVGLAPVQKEGIEYEFDILAEMLPDNTLIVSKTRCPALNGYICPKPNEETAKIIKNWLSDGISPTAAAPEEKPKDAPAAAEPPKAATEKKVISFPTSLKTENATAESETAAQTEETPKIKNGIFEGQGKLEKIVEKQEAQGVVYGYIVKGQPLGFRHYSAKAAAQAADLIGKVVNFKVLAGPNGYSLISIKAA